MTNREIQTVVHPLRRRELTVKRTELVHSQFQRITFTGADLSDFVSLSPDDHVKVFFRTTTGEEMRDYTPRRFDRAALELDIEFYLHGKGIGASWAANAKIGERLTVGGPRGSKIVPHAFDGYVLFADECAFPSVARRLTEMPKDAPVLAFLEVEDERSEFPLEAGPRVEIRWVHRKGRPAGSMDGFVNAARASDFPTGDCFAWISAEKTCAQGLREFLVAEKGIQARWTKATGYWSSN